MPRSEEIYEITRLCAHRDYRQPGQGGVLDKLVCGLFEHALSLGLRHMSMVTDAFLVAKALQFGWKLRPLGLPTPYREGTCIAGLVTVDHATLDGFYRTAGLSGSGPELRRHSQAVGRSARRARPTAGQPALSSSLPVVKLNPRPGKSSWPVFFCGKDFEGRDQCEALTEMFSPASARRWLRSSSPEANLCSSSRVSVPSTQVLR